jgi:Rieske 2Fe-2S family protein
VAPLLGRISAYDESVTTGCVGFLSYFGAMCDYAVAVTYVPQDVGVTQVVMRWLVRSDAVEGRDYDVANLCWLWDETTKQDKSIIELNAAGVASRGYIPGPYSRLEGMTADFIDRYLNLMTDPA